MDEIRFSYAAAERRNEREAAPVTQEGARCPHCGASVPEDCEICPSCGRKTVSWCTFCGAPLVWSDTGCPECGAPADGIVCPSCGTLSFRSFCPKCNSPLTRAATRMVEAAGRDPLCIEVAAQSARAEELERRLVEAQAAEIPALEAQLIKVRTDINALLGRMLPPAGSTPQEQRNYYSARKVAVETRTLTRRLAGWVCNYCGCTHSNPSECCKPFLGGKWVYEAVDEIKTDYRK